MAMLTGAMLQASEVKTVGLCHSVQGCARWLLRASGLEIPEKLQWQIAGINHQSWLLEITDGGKDLYPEIKKRAARNLKKIIKAGGPAAFRQKQIAKLGEDGWKDEAMRTMRFVCADMVRLQIMLDFGYYVTESSEHNAEYMPYWIKSQYPELIDHYGIPLDEYPRRCISQIESWKKRSKELTDNPKLEHKRTGEYGSYIMEAMETNIPVKVGGNVMNDGFVDNLPMNACVEVPCLVDRNGVQGCHVGELPPQCAAMNMTNINVQLLTIEAALTRSREHIYHAAMMDPHTAAELPIDKIKAMCDDLIAEHGTMLPKYR
jgi:alpha-galactosidase